jgi:hypothetical protein
MQNTETVVDEITEFARCFVSAVTGAEIIYAAFRAVSRFLPARAVSSSPHVIGDEATQIDPGLRFPVMAPRRLVIHSRSVEI